MSFIAITHCTVPGAAEELAEIIAAVKARQAAAEALNRQAAAQSPVPARSRAEVADELARAMLALDSRDLWSTHGPTKQRAQQAAARVDQLRIELETVARLEAAREA